MNQSRQFIGYFFIFIAVSLMWQSWQKQQDDARVAANKTLPQTATKHVETVSQNTSLEVAPAGRLVEVTTGLTRVKIDKLGGRVVAVDLLDYKKEKGGVEPVSFIGQDGGSYLTAQFGLTGDSALEYRASADTYQLGSNQSSLTVELTAQNNVGVDFVKTFTFYPDKYQFMVESTVKNHSDQTYSGTNMLSLSNIRLMRSHKREIGYNVFLLQHVLTPLPGYPIIRPKIAI